MPDATKELYAKLAADGKAKNDEWDALLKSYGDKYPKEHAELTRRIAGDLPEGWEKHRGSPSPPPLPLLSQEASSGDLWD